MQEVTTIVYRPDYVRPDPDKKRRKKDRKAIAEYNAHKRNAPDRCWQCIHFQHCTARRVSCDGWKDEVIHYNKG